MLAGGPKLEKFISLMTVLYIQGCCVGYTIIMINLTEFVLAKGLEIRGWR